MTLTRIIVSIALAMLSLPVYSADVPSLVILPGSGSQYSSQIRPSPTFVNANSLAANVAESQTVPTGARWVIFSGTCNFYANATTTATVPGDTTNGSASELNPAAWALPNSGAVTTISVISASTCVVTMSFYR